MRNSSRGFVARLLITAVEVDAHSSLLVPPSRNAVDRSLPSWSNGSWGDGAFGPDSWGCNCINATAGGGQVRCDVGQSCFYFSNGCGIGCPKCDGGAQFGANPNTVDRCGSGAVSTINDPKFRTYNRDAPAGSAADIYKHNPWRAAGTAPVFDACGMAGGFLHQEAGEAKYTPTKFAAQGKKGSELPPAPSGTVWAAGAAVETAISIRANHGGGYSFRLCPAGEALTEACFQRRPLRFVPGKQKLRWANGTELSINGTYVDVGTYPATSMWAMNPLPYSNAGSPAEFPPPCHERSSDLEPVPQSPQKHAIAPPAPDACVLQKAGPAEGYEQCTVGRSFCGTGKEYAFTGNNGSLADCAAAAAKAHAECFDWNPQSSGRHPFEHCRVAGAVTNIIPSGSGYTAYRTAGAFPPAPPAPPNGHGQTSDGYCSGQFPYNVMVVDTVEIPANLNPGEWVLGFRWDCEKSAQVWAACADVTIR